MRNHDKISKLPYFPLHTTSPPHFEAALNGLPYEQKNMVERPF